MDESLFHPSPRVVRPVRRFEDGPTEGGPPSAAGDAIQVTQRVPCCRFSRVMCRFSRVNVMSWEGEGHMILDDQERIEALETIPVANDL